MVNRRERVRAATVQEIKDVARRQLVTEGPAAVSLRAIAREMGMTAPALYRYFPSFEHLVQALISDMYHEACEALEQARDQVSSPGARFDAVCRTFRSWAVTHQAEFGLIFGSPMPGAPAADPSKAGAAAAGSDQGASRLTGIFLSVVTEIWNERQFTTPAPDDLESGLVEQLSGYREAVSSTLPLGALAVALGAWARLQGVVSLEVFNHLRFAYRDGACHGEPFFAQQLADVERSLGLR